MKSQPKLGDGAHETSGVSRDDTRQVIIRAATDLLTQGGRDAVTTRSVAAAAGVAPPVIYRFFGDKSGLLTAVVQAGFTEYMRAHSDAGRDCEDPVDDLRRGWDLAVRFGLENPELYTLSNGGSTDANSAAFTASMDMLMRRIRRISAAGMLLVDEELAALVIHATARGAVLTALALPDSERRPELLGVLREAMVGSITSLHPEVGEPRPHGAARALRASLDDQQALSAGERHLLGEWLDRIIDD